MSILLTMRKEDEIRRAKNVVVFGLPISVKELSKKRQHEDIANVEELFESLRIDRRIILKANRIRPKSDELKNTPVIVTLSRESDRILVLKMAKKLKFSSKFASKEQFRKN
ncbi:unnamed protein product [Brachionus calyciflorus]|uniref:Uncharacterized protein n=1 Tax=Brachionus calyciflorus TaxID=104777 RepID=A0A814EHL4_9BILA|nr:unnamed protein product [Brachionus calyciflorus]